MNDISNNPVGLSQVKNQDLLYYPINNKKILKTYLKKCYPNDLTNFNKFKVIKRIEKKDIISNEYKFKFDSLKYDGISKLLIKTSNTNWEYVQLLFQDIPRITLTKQQYETFYENNKTTKNYKDYSENEINIFNMFFNMDYEIWPTLHNIMSIKIKFRNDLKDTDYLEFDFIGCLILENEEKFRFLNCAIEYNIFTYRTQEIVLDLSKKEQKFIIDKNVPFSDISIYFKHKDIITNNIDKISIDNNDTTIDLIKMNNKNIGDYWWNSCLDKDMFSAYFYPKDWYLEFNLKNTEENKLAILCVEYCVPNMIQVNQNSKGKLYYYLGKEIKKEDLPSCPLSKISENKYAEGYWFPKIKNEDKLSTYSLDPEIDNLLPYPKQEENPDLQFYEKLVFLKDYFNKINYLGVSHDRIGNKNMGCAEYSFTVDNIEYIFPEGYLIYLKEYNVHPSPEFKTIIEVMWENVKVLGKKDIYKNIDFSKYEFNKENNEENSKIQPSNSNYKFVFTKDTINNNNTTYYTINDNSLNNISLNYSDISSIKYFTMNDISNTNLNYNFNHNQNNINMDASNNYMYTQYYNNQQIVSIGNNVIGPTGHNFYYPNYNTYNINGAAGPAIPIGSGSYNSANASPAEAANSIGPVGQYFDSIGAGIAVNINIPYELNADKKFIFYPHSQEIQNKVNNYMNKHNFIDESIEIDEEIKLAGDILNNKLKKNNIESKINKVVEKSLKEKNNKKYYKYNDDNGDYDYKNKILKI
jgi:hypothetical protein